MELETLTIGGRPRPRRWPEGTWLAPAVVAVALLCAVAAALGGVSLGRDDVSAPQAVPVSSAAGLLAPYTAWAELMVALSDPRTKVGQSPADSRLSTLVATTDAVRDRRALLHAALVNDRGPYGFFGFPNASPSRASLTRLDATVGAAVRVANRALVAAQACRGGAADRAACIDRTLDAHGAELESNAAALERAADAITGQVRVNPAEQQG